MIRYSITCLGHCGQDRVKALLQVSGCSIYEVAILKKGRKCLVSTSRARESIILLDLLSEVVIWYLESHILNLVEWNYAQKGSYML
jgi:hypothetical protein